MDREQFIRSVASIVAIMSGVLGLFSHDLLHIRLGFWYVLFGVTAALISIGVFKIKKGKRSGKTPNDEGKK